MARFIDSNDLFGRGVGVSTCGDFTCAICGTKYNEGNDKAENYDCDSVQYTDFAGVEICGDCFEAVEKEIIRRMSDILPWYKKILDSLVKQKQVVDDLIKETGGTSRSIGRRE